MNINQKRQSVKLKTAFDVIDKKQVANPYMDVQDAYEILCYYRLNPNELLFDKKSKEAIQKEINKHINRARRYKYNAE